MTQSNFPQTMTAIEIKEFGGPDVLQPTERPVPQTGGGDLLVRVQAAGVNRPDCMQRQGGYPPPPGAPDIPGLEIAGEVVAAGSDVNGFAPGDKVTGLVAGGGYAEYCLLPAACALPIPTGMSMVEAAALPETFFTVWTNLFDRARLTGGERVLIHGGASGIGTTAVQLARVFGARIFATAGQDSKCRAVEELGAEYCINYKSQDFVAEINRLTDNEGVDVVLDMVGGDYLPRNLKCLRTEGRLAQIAFINSAVVPDMNFAPMLMKRLTLTGSTLRPRTPAQKGVIRDALQEKVWPLLNNGVVKPILDSTFPLSAAAEAHHRIDSGDHIGKIMLDVSA